MKRNILVLLLFCVLIHARTHAQTVIQTEALVVGAGTGGTAAALQLARSGVQTFVVEPTNMMGGMLTAAAVSCTDGNHALPSGMWEEFRQALYKHYGKNNLGSGWVSNLCFEPKVADSIFKAWAKNEKKLQVRYGFYPHRAIVTKNRITGVVFINEQKQTFQVNAKIVIDATDLGDVFAMAGAAYDVGTDDPLVSLEKEAVKKTDIIQDLTWAAVLKDYGTGSDRSIQKPLGYNAKEYYCSNTNVPCDDKPWNGDAKKMLDYGKLPNNKYMLNWPAHGNDYYLNVVEKKPIDRLKEWKVAQDHTLGFIYFLQQELGWKHIGLAEDEVNKGMALIPYHREGRRVQGVVRFNINHIKQPYQFNLYRTGISVGDYPIDHHHAKYPGKVPSLQFPPIPSFNIPLGALIPATIDGLIVCDKGISVTNIANGTTRLQPVVFLTGQAAGVLASLSIQQNKQPRQIQVQQVQDRLLALKTYIVPFVDVLPQDASWKAVQKLGALGILRGKGIPEAWANRTYFYPDSKIGYLELIRNIEQLLGAELKVARKVESIFVLDYDVEEIAEAINRHIEKVANIAPRKPVDGPPVKMDILTKKEIANRLYNLVLYWDRFVVDLEGNCKIQ